MRSYELGIWFGPTCAVTPGPTFSCTPHEPLFANVRVPLVDRGPAGPLAGAAMARVRVGTPVDPAWLALPVPYRVPPERYRPLDVPWAVDRVCTVPDVHGRTWPPHDVGARDGGGGEDEA